MNETEKRNTRLRRAKGETFVTVGFDYKKTLEELHTKLTWDNIAILCGWTDRKGLDPYLKNNAIPSHVQGETLWALYVHIFNKKPPFKSGQDRAQFPDIAYLVRRSKR